MSTPTELPEGVVLHAHALAVALNAVAGDEAAVIDTLARIGGADPDDAAALSVATLIYTFSRCIQTDNPSTTDTKENTK